MRFVLLGLTLFAYTGGASGLGIHENRASNSRVSTAASSSGSIDCSLYGSPQACLDAGGVGSRVYFPPGVYSTPGLEIYSSQTVDCASGNILGGSGVVLDITGANWGVYNKNADSGSGPVSANNVINFVMRNCTIDISANPAALGGIHIKGVNFSQFYSDNIHTDNNSGPAVVVDGSNYENNGGSYFNDFYSLNIYDTAAQGTSTGVGVYITGDPTSGAGGNDDHWYGGSINFTGTSVVIDGGDNDQFYGLGMEGWNTHCISLTTNGSAAAYGNRFVGTRCEAASTNTNVSVQVGAGATVNMIDAYQSCTACVFGSDLSGGKNSYQNAAFGPAASAYEATVISSPARAVNVGINDLPGFYDGTYNGGLTIHGGLQTDRSFYIGPSSSSYHKFSSQATSVHNVTIPDAGGQIALTGSYNMFTNTQIIGPLGAASSQSNFSSNLFALQGSYWTGSAATNDTFYMHNVVGSTGMNPHATFVISHSGSTGLSTLQLTNINQLIYTSTPATETGNQSAPYLQQYGEFWNGTASSPDTWTLQPIFGAGANPTSTYTFVHAGSAGRAAVSVPSLVAGTYQTAVNCSSSISPAECGSAASGSVTLPASQSSVTIDTSAVTPNSQILLTFDSSLGTKLGITCNLTAELLSISARATGTFTVTGSAPSEDPACFSYAIVN